MLLHLLLLMMMTIKLVVRLCAEASRNWSWIAQLSRVQNQEVNKLLKDSWLFTKIPETADLWVQVKNLIRFFCSCILYEIIVLCSYSFSLPTGAICSLQIAESRSVEEVQALIPPCKSHVHSYFVYKKTCHSWYPPGWMRIY
jgi:hypothetical protein